MWQAQLECPIMNKALQPLLHAVDPLHGVEALEARVFHGVCNVRQRVKCEELRRLRELGAAIVQICLEIDLLGFELLLSPLAEVLVIVRMEDVNDKVQVQIELKLLRQKVASKHVLRNEHLPRLEELIFLPTIKGAGKRIKERFRIIIQPMRRKRRVIRKT